ncbi:MAG TPA: ATP-binding protein [Planctomycetaceae bacterium]|jgi:serine/threonine-protein kinase RsbW|nr:ATP-binding protein [Planctomycetaceae bacterium]
MSSLDERIEEFEIFIPSDTTAGQSVQDRIVRFLEDLQYNDRDVFGVRLAMEEALVNAIKHGNRMDPNKSVRIACRISHRKIRIEIEDQGSGFQPESVPDPTADENLERPCGRGIMLMRAFMNLIEYNEAGNRVVLEKHRSAESSE